MRTLRYELADVFTDRPFGGNPLAVFPEAGGLSDPLMAAIARELNLSESVFVVPPEDPAHAARLRIFTPASELPFAGHPTVGAACVLAELGAFGDGSRIRIVFEETAGLVPVVVERGAVGVSAVLTSPRLPEPIPLGTGVTADAAAAVLGLRRADLDERADGPAAYSAGVPFLVVPLRDRTALASARMDGGAWARTLQDTSAPHVYAIAIDPAQPGTVRARMFAPAMGIAEDPATGAAAAAVAGYLGRDLPDGVHRWRIHQGVELGRPSLLELEAERAGGAFIAVRVGGGTVRMGSAALFLPPEVPDGSV